MQLHPRYSFWPSIPEPFIFSTKNRVKKGSGDENEEVLEPPIRFGYLGLFISEGFTLLNFSHDCVEILQR